MIKVKHEIRDPVHGFIKMSSDERKILDSFPLQRLRDIHQLGLTYLVYPSSTHKRFEHSLGVVEPATKVFDVITTSENIHSRIEESLPEINEEGGKGYWRKVVRIAALCHDVGHLPFSHTGENELMPEKWNHERMTVKILKEKLASLFEELTPPVRVEDVIKIATGPRVLSKINSNMKFSKWETILAEIIVGDVFGADRMDYLLRDSHHLGVPYGEFDHFRLIDCLRILPDPQSGDPKIGIEIGGLHVAESLLLSRYFMYSQVYLHHVRRIHDIHLREFVKSWLKKTRDEPHFPIEVEEFLAFSDSNIILEILGPSNEHRHKITKREHYRLIYERSLSDIAESPEAVRVIYCALREKFGEGNVKIDEYEEEGGIADFPIIDRNGEIASSQNVSKVLNQIPRTVIGFVFVNPDLKNEAKEWLDKNRIKILERAKKEVKYE